MFVLGYHWCNQALAFDFDLTGLNCGLCLNYGLGGLDCCFLPETLPTCIIEEAPIKKEKKPAAEKDKSKKAEPEAKKKKTEAKKEIKEIVLDEIYGDWGCDFGFCYSFCF